MGRDPGLFGRRRVIGNDIERDLGLAVAGAIGISKGSAHTFSNLLLECVGGFSLAMLNRPRFRRSRVFQGEHCSRITGIHPRVAALPCGSLPRICRYEKS